MDELVDQLGRTLEVQTVVSDDPTLIFFWAGQIDSLFYRAAACGTGTI
jgi:hypothetical protein